MNLIKKILYRIRGTVGTEELMKNGLRVGVDFQREEGCIIDPSHCFLITIGDHVTLAPRVHILAHDASMHRALGYTFIAPVTIGSRVFIGAGSIVLPGVTIGDDCVIGAGSVVTKDIPSGSVAVGNPARCIKSHEEFLSKQKEQMTTLPLFDESYTFRNKDFVATMREEMKARLDDAGGGFVE